MKGNLEGKAPNNEQFSKRIDLIEDFRLFLFDDLLITKLGNLVSR